MQERYLIIGKGQLISKCLFGVFTFFQKTNKNKSTSSKVEFVWSFFWRNVILKKSFRIYLTFRRTWAWAEEETNFSKLILDCLDLSADLELTKIDEPRSSSVFHKNISFKNCGGWARKPPTKCTFLSTSFDVKTLDRTQLILGMCDSYLKCPP